jgi:hypothetical protein
MASVLENKPVQPIANPSPIESQNRTLWLIIVSTGVTFIAFIFIRSYMYCFGIRLWCIAQNKIIPQLCPC